MEKKVVFHFNPISVVAKGKNEKELLENAKKEFIKQIQKEFPHFQYSFSDANALSLQTAKGGMIIETIEGEFGIITRTTAKKVYAVLTGGRVVSANAEFFKESNKSFEQVRSKRKGEELGMFFEGDSGFLKVQDGKIAVVISNETKGKFKAYSVEKPGSFYTVTEQQLKSFFSDER